MKNTVVFDLTSAGEFCEGKLVFTDNKVLAYIDEQEIFSHSLDDIAELRQYTDIGCGRLEMVQKTEDGSAEDISENIYVCRFSMSAVYEIGEFCKVVNHYIKTGEVSEVKNDENMRCPKCGRHLIKGMDVCLFCVDKGYIWKRAFLLMKPFMPGMIFSLIMLIMSNLLTALVPLLNSRMMDNYLSPVEGVVPMFEPVKGIIVIGALMALCYLFGQGASILSARKANRISAEFTNNLRMLVYDKIQKFSLASISKKTSGDLMKRITRDTQHLRRFMTDLGMFSIEQAFMFIIVATVLIIVNPLLTFLVFIPVPIILFAISKIWGYIRLRYEKEWRCGSREASILHDIIKGIRVVKTFGNEEREIAKFSDAGKRLADISIKNGQFWAVTVPTFSFLVGVGEFFVLLIGGKMVVEGRMTAGNLLEFILFLPYLYQPLRWLSSLPRHFAEATTSLIKIFEVLDEKDTVADIESPVTDPINGDLAFNEVQFGYKSYEPVLKDVNLEVKSGEMIGLVGPSGAGKSTMINLVMRLYDADIGKLTIDGKDIKDFDQRYLRENIGVVFQETFLSSGSVYDNIAYAKPGASPAEVINAAKVANAHEFIMKLIDGYNTVVGENGHNLSGGERQRIAIARAVLKNPKILILDEATSALDPETEEKIQEALQRLVKDRTTIAIAHRLSTLRHADRLVVLKDGHIAESGAHRELLAQKGIYYELVMAQRQTAKLKKDDQAVLDE